MIDFEYLDRGLTGMARAHRANTMAGHLGAAVVAGVFFSEDHPDLDERVTKAVKAELDQIVAGDEAIWFNPTKAGITIPELFEPFPKAPPVEADISNIGAELAADILELRQSGHDVIFATIALRALHDHPESASPAVVGGIRKLIGAFHGQSQGRGYYGKDQGWKQGQAVKLPAEDPELPMYEDEDAMVDAVIDELIAFGGVRRQGFGGLFHLINHAAAITELARLGYRDMARQALAAHHRHLRLLHTLPDLEAELGPLVKAQHSPRTPEYWEADRDSEQWGAQLTHRIKTLYGFHTILQSVEDEAKREKAQDAFLYLMG